MPLTLCGTYSGGVMPEAWRVLSAMELWQPCVNPPTVKKLANIPGLTGKCDGDARHRTADFGKIYVDGSQVWNTTEFMTWRMEDTNEDATEAVVSYVRVKANLGGSAPTDIDAVLKVVKLCEKNVCSISGETHENTAKKRVSKVPRQVLRKGIEAHIFSREITAFSVGSPETF